MCLLTDPDGYAVRVAADASASAKGAGAGKKPFGPQDLIRALAKYSAREWGDWWSPELGPKKGALAELDQEFLGRCVPGIGQVKALVDGLERKVEE